MSVMTPACGHVVNSEGATRGLESDVQKPQQLLSGDCQRVLQSPLMMFSHFPIRKSPRLFTSTVFPPGASCGQLLRLPWHLSVERVNSSLDSQKRRGTKKHPRRAHLDQVRPSENSVATAAIGSFIHAHIRSLICTCFQTIIFTRNLC